MSFFSCSDTTDKNVEITNWKHEVIVNEVIQTSSYTYLLVSENNDLYWIAISGMDVNVEDILYYNSGLEMVEFKSKELQRTFDKLLLVQVISNDGSKVVERSTSKNTVKRHQHTNNVTTDKPAEDMGLVSLEDLFANINNYNGKKITVSGKVVKFNSEIMGRNWVHIMDADNNYDLTITTNNYVKLEDEVTFEGVITLNKDFGSGYSYEIIMEKAVLK